MALYIDAAVLERLARRDPFDALTHENLADYLTAAEGVSHFVYVAWNTGHDKPVTLLELELQAEVDKYVLGAWLLRAAGRRPFSARAAPRTVRARARRSGRGRRPRRACTTWLRITPRGSAGAWRALLERRRAASRATSWRSCAVSIAGGMCASCATSNATPERGRSTASAYSTSLSSWDLRASSSRLSLIHSPSLRRSLLDRRLLGFAECARRRRARTDRNRPRACVRPSVWRARLAPASVRWTAVRARAGRRHSPRRSTRRARYPDRRARSATHGAGCWPAAVCLLDCSSDTGQV